jgi:hypothetical protein
MEVDTVVQVSVVGMSDGAIRAEVDLDAVGLEVGALSTHHLVPQRLGGKLDEVLLWEVLADHEVVVVEAILVPERLLTATRSVPGGGESTQATSAEPSQSSLARSRSKEVAMKHVSSSGREAGASRNAMPEKWQKEEERAATRCGRHKQG